MNKKQYETIAIISFIWVFISVGIDVINVVIELNIGWWYLTYIPFLFIGGYSALKVDKMNEGAKMTAIAQPVSLTFVQSQFKESICLPIAAGLPLSFFGGDYIWINLMF